MKSRRIGWGTYNDWEKGKLDAGVSFEITEERRSL
jgi:hypothetical protein